MKEIKSEKYLLKKAIYEDLPVGDPGLPGNMTQGDIPGGLDPDEVDNQTGETEVAIDWNDFSETLSERTGWQLPDFLIDRNAPSDILMEYTYSYDYNNNESSNINVVRVKDYISNQIITDRQICDVLAYYFRGDIVSDIENAEEGAKIERDPHYNPYEEF